MLAVSEIGTKNLAREARSWSADQLFFIFGKCFFSTDDANSDEDTTKLTKSVKKGDIYVPPKLAAVPYNFDETPKDRLQKQNERAKKRALHSSIVQELRQEYYDEPEEVHDRDIYRMKTDKRAKEREEYEERNMIRLNVSKKDKAKSKRMTTMGNLSHLADFQDFRPMADDEDGEGNFGMSKTKKRKKAQKGKVSENIWCCFEL